MKKEYWWIIGGITVLGTGIGLYAYFNSDKYKDKQREKNESDKDVVVSETKEEDFTEYFTNTSVDASTSGNYANLDLIQSLMGTNVKRNPTTVVAMLENSSKKVIFYSNDRYTISRAGDTTGFIQKGTYRDGGRKLIATDGLNKGKTITGPSVWRNLRAAT